VSTASVTDGLGGRSARLRTAATRDEALARTGGMPSGPVPASSAFRDSRLLEGHGAVTDGAHARRLFVVTAAQFRDEKWERAALRGTGALLVLGYITEADWRFQVNADDSLDTGRLGVPIDAHAARFR
jgi:hypothetical protein